MGAPDADSCSTLDKASSRYLAFAEDESGFTTEELVIPNSMKFDVFDKHLAA